MIISRFLLNKLVTEKNVYAKKIYNSNKSSIFLSKFYKILFIILFTFVS